MKFIYNSRLNKLLAFFGILGCGIGLVGLATNTPIRGTPQFAAITGILLIFYTDWQQSSSRRLLVFCIGSSVLVLAMATLFVIEKVRHMLLPDNAFSYVDFAGCCFITLIAVIYGAFSISIFRAKIKEIQKGTGVKGVPPE